MSERNTKPITVFPAHVFSVGSDVVTLRDQWVRLEDGKLHSYGVRGDKSTVFRNFMWKTSGYTSEAVSGKISHTFYVEHPDHGEIVLLVEKTGGCGCSDPRKNLNTVERMERRVSRTNASAETKKVANTRRAVAKRRATITRKKNFQAAEEARRSRGVKRVVQTGENIVK